MQTWEKRPVLSISYQAKLNPSPMPKGVEHRASRPMVSESLRLQPLMQISGSSRATTFARPARAAAFTTAATSL